MSDLPRRGSSTWFIYLVFLFSGVAGLGYQIVWTRMFAVGLGHEVPGMLAVIAAFFGGLALGSLVLDRPISRSRRPGRWYAGLELIIAAWSALTIALIPMANAIVPELTGPTPSPLRHWLVAFIVPFVALLPATAAMGGTLPAMDRLCSRLRREGRSVGGLYASNTLGAVLGTLGSALVIIPWLGYRSTIVLFVVINLICALAILFGPARSEDQREEVIFTFSDRPRSARLLATLLFTGFLGIGYEVLAIRVMAQVLENTVYSFASGLGVYLLGTAAGGAMYQRLLKRSEFTATLNVLLILLASTGLLGVFVLMAAPEIYEGLRTAFDEGFAASFASEFLLATAVFAPVTVLMGATFSHLAQAARDERGGVGRALAINTIGGSLGPPVFGVLMLPALGAKLALIIVSIAYLALIPRLDRRAVSLFVLPAALALVALPGAMLHIEAPANGRILVAKEGVLGTTAVVADQQGNRFLKVNNKFMMGGTQSDFAEKRQAHLPLLLHPAPRSSLFLGLGTGITFAAVKSHDSLRADGVELVPEVVEVLGYFEQKTGGLAPDPDLRIIVGDARRFVQAIETRYDVIIADLFHPARDGAGSLYTVEHFSAVKQCLAEDGLFCQWLPLYQLDDALVRLITRTFLEVFPDCRAVLAHFNAGTPMLGLIGGLGDRTYPSDWLDRRAADPQLQADLARVLLDSELDLFGCFVAESDGLRRFAGHGPLNTDDNPVVIFRAPHYVYRHDQQPWRNLQIIIDELELDIDTLVSRPDAEVDSGFSSRLESYWQARDLYLRGEIANARGRPDEAIEFYLQSAAASEDFGPARALLTVIADRTTDAALSRRIRRQLGLSE